MRGVRIFRKRLLIALFACAAPPLAGQVPPSAGEAARFSGLHAAAHKGDAAAIRRLATAGSDLNATAAHGRTALQVATFSRQLLETAGAR